MSSINVQPIVELVRFYGGGSYSEKSPYLATVNIIYESDDTVLLMGLCGKFNKDFYLLIREYLFNKNIKYLKMERKGRTVKRSIKISKEV